MSTKERLDCLVIGYMTNEFSIKTRNYQHALNFIIIQLLGDEFMQMQKTLDKLPQYVRKCHSQRYYTEGIKAIKKILSFEPSPIQYIIDSGVVPRLIKIVESVRYSLSQLQAASCLAIISSGTASHKATLVKYDAIPKLIYLLKCRSDEVKTQCIWILGNIANNSEQYTNLILSHDILSEMISMSHTNINTKTQLKLLQNLTWTLSNLCHYQPFTDSKYFQLAMGILLIMITSDDPKILHYSCCACNSLSYISSKHSNDGEGELSTIANSRLLSRLIELLDHLSLEIRHPALRTIGNIVAGDDEHTQQVINSGILNKLPYLIQNDVTKIQQEAMWIVSNITAGSNQQIQAVINSDLFETLVHVLCNEEYEIAQEALWAIHNAVSGGSDEQISILVKGGVIQSLCQFLKKKLCSNIMLTVLEVIENILICGDRISTDENNQFVQYLLETDVIDSLKELQSNPTCSHQICFKVTSILKLYLD